MPTPKKNEVLMSFKTAEQAKEFMRWLCDSGEQYYFDDTGGEEPMNTNIVDSFDYDFERNIIIGS